MQGVNIFKESAEEWGETLINIAGGGSVLIIQVTKGLVKSCQEKTRRLTTVLAVYEQVM